MMRLIRMAAMTMAATLAALCVAAPASAQATRTWISGVGDDANPCSRTAPCKTFAGAISKTASGGEIDCLDPGGFGGVTITKSITLDCGSGPGGQVGSILVAGTNGITINAANVNVVVRNVTIDGIQGAGTPGLVGIRFLQGNSLTIEHVSINGFGNGGANTTTSGISFEPSVAGANLVVRNVDIFNNLQNGIGIKPTGVGTALATLDHVSISTSAIALQVEDNSTAVVTNSSFSNNAFRGVFANSSAGGPVNVSLDSVTVANNVFFGVVATNATIRLSNVGVYSNGSTSKITGTGSILSFGNNRLGTSAGNGGASATLTPVSLQ
ncbi:hypothetical protein QH494_11475 [Sphingomonas sp. AR_OL41]|uniref:hypothetical protein n=1 Tax=Sphingomonas sp. AR_OL41 TaxID=3042729 RepID=UPI0024815845|nr:hypothetical protein [Sphingomonas sp. AR_OL41]MDH7972806.1 hypothetical protein [Sphingomonas sp. AR_OL41]